VAGSIPTATPVIDQHSRLDRPTPALQKQEKRKKDNNKQGSKMGMQQRMLVL
jgi:hypothetical protein